MEIQVFILLTFCGITFAAADLSKEKCPPGCVCRKRDVKCYALTDFPVKFPPLTTYIFMDEMNIQTIPPNSFLGLEFLNTIEFQRSNFGSISTCAFKSIQSLEKLIFFKSVIGHLDKLAIFNNTGLLNVEIIKSKITKVSPFAIGTLDNIASFSLEETTIYDLKTMSIVNVSGKKLSIVGSVFKTVHYMPFVFGKFSQVKILNNTFEMLPCGTIDNLLVAAVDNNTLITGNAVMCDCGISYIHKIQDVKQKELLNNMYCLDGGVINSQRIVSEALSGALPCDQKNKETITKCRTQEILKLPKLVCPSYSHGGVYKSSESNNRNSASSLPYRITVLILTIFVFL
ncbi:uncharacterized protein LOC127730553 [Mytilus californianus]|uniref:uncharacterized protein LOC127730553 n=1 Tax=Mytilus californianus TaxID=6549 RepID=UPI00224516D1|nr:uncharacterized protein LOC127730553 [Mytilus californianus]XP_052094959.1 uncharacterized protein LOC127730553 [Mytilus californianus]